MFSIVVQIILVRLSVTLPVVTRRQCSSAGPQNCTFEWSDTGPDPCGWSQHGDMEHNWQLRNEREFDDTLRPRKAGSSGRLESVETCSAVREHHCLSVRYWIYSGRGSVSLTVYLDQTRQPRQQLWRNTSYSKGWRTVAVTFQTSSSFKMVIEAAWSQGADLKHVSIGALWYHKGPCKESQQFSDSSKGMTPTLANDIRISSYSSACSLGPQNCTFSITDHTVSENHSSLLCGWSKHNDMDLLRAARFGNKTNYSLGPKNAGSFGWLKTVDICSTAYDDHCLTLSYQISQGKGIASLSLHLQQTRQPTLLLWSTTSVSHHWEITTVNFQTTASFSIVIRAVRSQDAVAKTVLVDKVWYYKGPCLENRNLLDNILDTLVTEQSTTVNDQGTRALCLVVGFAMAAGVLITFILLALTCWSLRTSQPVAG